MVLIKLIAIRFLFIFMDHLGIGLEWYLLMLGILVYFIRFGIGVMNYTTLFYAVITTSTMIFKFRQIKIILKLFR